MRWLSYTCKCEYENDRMAVWYRVCVNLFNNQCVRTCLIMRVSMCPHGCPRGRFETQTVCGHHFSLQRLSGSTSAYSPTHCQVPLTSSLLSCENVGPLGGVRKKDLPYNARMYAHKGMWLDIHTFILHTHSIQILKQFLYGRQSVKWLRLTEGNGA